MKALKYVWIGWIAAWMLAACTEGLSSPRVQIAEAEQLLQQHAEEAIVMLQSVKEPETLPDSLRARFALVMGQAHYNAHWMMNEDSLLLYALDYYGSPGVSDTTRLLRACKLAAHHLYDSEKYKEATAMIAEGNRIAILRGDTAARLDLLHSLENIGNGNDDFEGLLRLHKQLIAIETDSTYRYANYNMLAVLYYYTNKNDSALLALDRAAECLYTAADSVRALEFVIRNQADFLAECGEYQKAVDLQHRVLRQYEATGNPLRFYSYYSLSRYYLNMGQMELARYYKQRSDSLSLSGLNQDWSLASLCMVQKTLMDYVDTHSFTIRNVAFFANRLYNDFLRDQRIINQKGKMQWMLQQQNMSLQLAKQKERTFLVALVALCVLLLLVVVWYLQRRKHLLVEKEEELEALRHLLHETEGDNGESNDKFIKKMLLQQLGLIRIVATNPSSDHQELLVQMGRIANKDVVADELLVWSDLYQTIDMVHDGFYTRIHRKYGSVLSEKELQLCCLLKSDFSTKEISVVIQQSVRTVYQRKTVIRQKLGMEEKEDIAEFLSASA